MQLDAAGRVQLVPSLPMLRPDEQVLRLMLEGWRNQQLSRNLRFATVEQRLRCVQRFLDHVNEDPWHWTPAMVEEFSADLRCVSRVAQSTLRGYHAALRAFTSYLSNPDYGWDPGADDCVRAVLRHASRAGLLRLEHRAARAVRRRAAGQASVHPPKSSTCCSSTRTRRSSGSAGPPGRAGNPPTGTR
jgi:hypothetical protein